MSYRENTPCPGCTRSQWLIGRSTAECAFCGTALPLADSRCTQAPRIVRLGKGGGSIRRQMVLA